MDDSQSPTPEPVWCVVANVVMERAYGPGGAERRSGTKHFAPGARVYVVGFYWGTGGESVTVVGRHRKSHRFITLDMRSRHLANWRAELVYSPYVIERVREHGAFSSSDPSGEEARLEAERIARSYMERGPPSPPFVARPPTA